MADYLRESGVKWLWEKIKTLLSAKQDKLVSGSNIKTINGASILGSGDVSISGDASGSVDEGRLVLSDNYAPRGTLLDNIMKISGNNVLAFMPPSAITIEYSTDNGVTWLDYGWNDNYKTSFVTPEFGANGLFLGKNSSSLSINNRLRITFDFIAANMRFTPSKACIYFSGVNNSDSFYTKLSIEKYNNYTKDVWEELSNQKITNGSWGTFRLPTEDWGYKGDTYRARFRCEFYRTADSIHSTAIGNIIIMTTNIVTANSYAKNHHLYTFGHQQNATFPNAITATKHITQGGTSNQVVLGNGSLKALSEISPITDADADILLDNHIHNIDVYANGNVVNISVIESSKNGNTWETEDNDIPIPLATTTSAGVMSKEDKIKSDGLLIYYHLTEDEYTNHELVSLYSLVLAIKDELFDSTTNKWKYDDSKSYDVRVKGWTLQDNGITYLNVNVRLLTSQGGHSIGFSGFADVDFITETYFDAIIPLYIGYICGKYHIENDGMTVVAPEDSGFYIEV